MTEHIRAVLGLNVTPFQRSTQKALSSARRFREQMTRIGSVLGTALLGKLVSDMAKLGDELSTIAEQTGLTTTELQKLQFAAEKTGSSAEQMNNGMEAFAKRVGQARMGTGELNTVLKKYGVSLRKANGEQKSVRELLGDVTHLLHNASDEAEEAAIAAAAFSRANQSLSVTLNKGNKDLEKMGDEAERVGAILKEDAIKNLDKLDKAIKTLKRSFLGLAGGFIAKIVSGWVAIFDVFNSIRMEAGRLFSGDFGGFMEKSMNRLVQLQKERLDTESKTTKELNNQRSAMQRLIEAQQALRRIDQEGTLFSREGLLNADTSNSRRLRRAQNILRYTEALRQRALNETRLGVRSDNQNISDEERARRELQYANRIERRYLRGILQDSEIRGIQEEQNMRDAATAVLDSLGLQRPGLQRNGQPLEGQDGISAAVGQLGTLNETVGRMETNIRQLNQ